MLLQKLYRSGGLAPGAKSVKYRLGEPPDCWYVYVGHIPWSWVCRALLTPAAMRDKLGDEVDIDDAVFYEWPLSDPE